MTHEDAFLQAVCESPEDDTPRFVYADWLDEHGRYERAEFIRVQCQLACMAVFDDRRRQLQKQQQLLLESHGRKWLTQEWPQAANPSINGRTFERGFVAEVSFRGRELGEAGVGALVKNPRLALLTALDLRKNGITGRALLTLAASSLLGRLAFLDLRENLFATEALRAVATSPHLGELRELVVGPKGIRFDAVDGWFRRQGKDVATHSGNDYLWW
jgi:uncharacterized protein (TIGR02996 family)